jgi:hypothetical protein
VDVLVAARRARGVLWAMPVLSWACRGRGRRMLLTQTPNLQRCGAAILVLGAEHHLHRGLGDHRDWAAHVLLRQVRGEGELLRRRARHLPATVAGVDTHGASIMCRFVGLGVVGVRLSADTAQRRPHVCGGLSRARGL